MEKKKKLDKLMIHNDFSRSLIPHIQRSESDLLMLIFQEIRLQKNNTITLTFSEILEMSGLSNLSNYNTERFIEQFSSRQIQQNTKLDITKHDGSRKIVFLNIFDNIMINQDEKTVDFTLANGFRYYADGFSDGNFTMLPKEIYLDLQPQRAKKLLLLLLTRQNLGKITITKADLYHQLEVKSEMLVKEFNNKILKKCLLEINSQSYIKNLTYTTSRRSGKIYSYNFTFDKIDKNHPDFKKLFYSNSKQKNVGSPDEMTEEQLNELLKDNFLN